MKKKGMKSGKIQPGGKSDIDRLGGVEVDPFAPSNLGKAKGKKKKKKKFNQKVNMDEDWEFAHQVSNKFQIQK
jgi:hypothetical protein